MRACRLEMLETEVGRDHLEALAVGTRAARLEQQVALLGQQLAAQRCVASFLGAHEVPLRKEIAALRQVRIGCFRAPLCISFALTYVHIAGLRLTFLHMHQGATLPLNVQRLPLSVHAGAGSNDQQFMT